MADALYPDSFNFGADVVDHFARHADKLALIALDSEGRERRYRFSDIARLSASLADALASRGVDKGDRVIIMLPRIAEWQIAMVACLKLGAIAIPCIDMLTAKDVAYRVQRSGAIAAITTAKQIGKFAEAAPDLAVKISVGDADGWEPFETLIASGDPAFEPRWVDAEDPVLLYFTSGSTGQPKGVLHAARGLYLWRHSAIEWLDLKPDDMMWCTADTGWSKAGTSILFGPWSCGAAVLFHDAPFDAAERLRLIETYRVTVFCGSNTELLRLLEQDLSRHDLSSLRRTVTAGETLSAVAAERWERALGHRIAEAYGQTETLMSLGYRSDTPYREGSTGKPLAHNQVAIIDDDGRVVAPGAEGNIAIKAPNPQIMIGYWDDPQRTAECYVESDDGRWFVTGDRGEIDEDGYFHHRGRRDDLINSSGYRIGPAEVEDVLRLHPAVLDVAVVGVPDPARGELVCAHIILREGQTGDDALVAALQQHVKTLTAPYKYPRIIRFVPEFPKTMSGKLQRHLVRAEARAAATAGREE